MPYIDIPIPSLPRCVHTEVDEIINLLPEDPHRPIVAPFPHPPNEDATKKKSTTKSLLMGEYSRRICDYPNGQYIGDMIDDKRSGQGRMTTPEEFYDGMWSHDFQHGYGEMTYFLDGSSYKGEWKNGLKHGRGVFNFKIQAKGVYMTKYDGEWENDKQKGRGIVTWSNGSIERGVWDGINKVKK